MSSIYVDVALGIPASPPYQYSVPDALKNQVAIGKAVFVLVRNRRMMGYIVGISDTPAFPEVKEISSLPPDFPALPESFLELTRWMADAYFCGWGQCLEAALPAPFKKGKFLMKSRTAGLSKETVDSLNPEDLSLTAAQESAYQKIVESLRAKNFASYLLYGITGSGKTEIYMHLIREALKEGRGSIMLVPEISLTPQAVERFYSRFGDRVTVIHSRLSQAKRVEEWHRIRSGAATVVIGPRSAVFSPVKNLGLIFIDEEHETSYKQEDTPRYQTREVARKRCELEGAVLVAGSATPSLESFFYSEHQRSKRLELPERIEKRPLPVVEIIDMRQEYRNRGGRIFSVKLEQAIRDALARKEQVMLFLNRRGFATFLHCSSCGHVMTCENCRITLAYHYDKAALFCHLCQFRSPLVKVCPSCQKSHLHYFGIGTQKVESEALKLFPGAKIGRMDTDSTSKKNAHETILKSFKKREIDILIGTQMIAKGHDFPNVSLIGVVSADTALHIPDFRASERTFGLLTQVAGRAGRGDIPGQVIVQTSVPGHYAIQSAKHHNYKEFYEKEKKFREELFLPPYSHLAKLVVAGLSEKEVMRQALTLARLFEINAPAEGARVAGPAPCLASKEGGNFMWNLFVKGPTAESVNKLIRRTLQEFKKSRITISVDVDPQ